MKDNFLLQFLEKKRNYSSKKELNPPKKKLEKKKFHSSQSNKFSKSIPTFSYSYNTYEGKVRNYNEDKIQIKIDLKIPNNEKNIIWPPIHYFAIFDGHGGNKCSDFLKENFHKLLIENKNFPRKPIKSLKQTFVNIEKLFFNKFKPKNLIDNIEYSGSCVIIILIIEYKVYCANLGDSRALYSQNSSKEIYQINKEHKPNLKSEKERIYKNGGKIYQNENNLGLINIPWRILPGRLAVY
jgi:serine/threonine protein phosphatase PrpC